MSQSEDTNKSTNTKIIQKYGKVKKFSYGGEDGYYASCGYKILGIFIETQTQRLYTTYTMDRMPSFSSLTTKEEAESYLEQYLKELKFY